MDASFAGLDLPHLRAAAAESFSDSEAADDAEHLRGGGRAHVCLVLIDVARRDEVLHLDEITVVCCIVKLRRARPA